jgi:hypothetical protein
MQKMTRRSLLSAIPAVGLVPIIPAIAAPVDPLLDLITEYRQQVAVFAAIPDDDLTKDSEPEYVAATYEPSMNDLLYRTPQTRSLAGVREAIRLAFTESGFCCILSENVLRSALAYLDGEVLA